MGRISINDAIRSCKEALEEMRSDDAKTWSEYSVEWGLETATIVRGKQKVVKIQVSESRKSSESSRDRIWGSTKTGITISVDAACEYEIIRKYCISKTSMRIPYTDSMVFDDLKFRDKVINMIERVEQALSYHNKATDAEAVRAVACRETVSEIVNTLRAHFGELSNVTEPTKKLSYGSGYATFAGVESSMKLPDGKHVYFLVR